MIDSKFADMKNTGGGMRGRLPPRQFSSASSMARLGRISTSQAPGWGSPASEINQSWGSGFGVRCSTGSSPIITRDDESRQPHRRVKKMRQNKALKLLSDSTESESALETGLVHHRLGHPSASTVSAKNPVE